MDVTIRSGKASIITLIQTTKGCQGMHVLAQPNQEVESVVTIANKILRKENQEVAILDLINETYWSKSLKEAVLRTSLNRYKTY